MVNPAFVQLHHELQEHRGLRSSKRPGLAEKVAIVLRVSRTERSRQGIRATPARTRQDFGVRLRSWARWNTERKILVFWGWLDVIASKAYYNRYVKLPSTDEVPPRNHNSANLFLFFKGLLKEDQLRAEEAVRNVPQTVAAKDPQDSNRFLIRSRLVASDIDVSHENPYNSSSLDDSGRVRFEGTFAALRPVASFVSPVAGSSALD